MLPLSFQMLLLMFAGWVNRQQLEVIEYLKEQNGVRKERLGEQRIRFTGAERCRLARKAHALGRKALSALETPVTPDTLLHWYRTLIARKWNYSHRRGPGRPRTQHTIVERIVRMDCCKVPVQSENGVARSNLVNGSDVCSASTKARRVGTDAKRVNVDFPAWMVDSLDREARRLGVTRQSLTIKLWLAEKLGRPVAAGVR